VSDGVRTRGLNLGKVARCHLRHAHKAPSLLAASNRPPPSYQDGALPDELRRHREEGVEPPHRKFKVSRPAISRFPMRAAPRCRAGPPGLQGRSRSRARRQGVRPPGLEPGSTWPSTMPVYQLRHERLEPSSGVEPDLLPYEGKCTAVCDGVAAGQGLEPRFAGSEPAVLPLDDPAIGRCARRESNPHPPAFEAGRSASWLTRAPECAASASNREPPD
jgi:hypothetical protein